MPTRFDKLLVLDLDETLFLACKDPLPRPPDFRVGPYAIYKRPGLDQFLRTCLEWFTVGVWTSSSGDYASEVLGHLLPSPAHLAFLWTRDRCTRKLDPRTYEERWIKDLKKLKNAGYRLENIIFADDSPEKLSRNYGNLVRVSEFTGDADDRELPMLLEYLALLGGVENVRAVEKRGWREKIVKSGGRRATA